MKWGIIMNNEMKATNQKVIDFFNTAGIKIDKEYTPSKPVKLVNIDTTEKLIVFAELDGSLPCLCFNKTE
jgi:hypothetical protein